MSRVSAALLLALLLFSACTRDTVTRAEWERMPHADRVMYVNSLIGSERAKNAKGGRGRTVTRSAEEVVARIDRVYQNQNGEQRPVHEIFQELSR